MIKIPCKEELNFIIQNAFEEDLKDGDHSSLGSIFSYQKGQAKLLVKENCTISGVALSKLIFRKIDPSLQIETLKNDGDDVEKGELIFYVEGSIHSILKAERIVLNFMQRMSAITTKTKKYKKLIEGTKAKILDTRKTTPCIRIVEKWAVKIGGGENHRFGLYDMIMLKDNHIDASGGVAKAIENTQQYLTKNKLNLKIIVEARSLKEIEEILKFETIERILIDNFDIEQTKKAVNIIGKKCDIESSGGIDEKNIVSYAMCGVDYISLGTLTHSINNIDLSLKII